ncbi:MAG: DUF3592 domain-containing protein [Flavobacteriaceae bacterium]
MPYQICLIAGLTLLVLSCFLLYRNISFLKNTERAKGEVIELKKIHRSTSKPTYKPVFEFVTKEGKTIMHTSMSSSNPPTWKQGEKVIYAYKSEAPDKGKIVTYYGVFGWVVALACLAFPLLIIGGGYFISEWYFQSAIS